MYAELAILALIVFVYSTVAGRVERTVISGPMVFVVTGFLFGPSVLGWLSGNARSDDLRVLAELTLAVVLFNDASNVNFSVLKSQIQIPTRMLLLGLPGAVLLGFGFAVLLFDDFSLYEAAILATMLAATDAALGKAVITNESVPARLREGLNVESGLNDGICVPILLFFIALAASGKTGGHTESAMLLVAKELGIGAAVGLGLTHVGARLLHWCAHRGWVNGIWLQITAIALALACFAVAHSLHGSGFIAAFTGGMYFGYLAKAATHKLVFASEGVGETLALVTWMLFGALVIGPAFKTFTWDVVLYAVLSLTVIRMLPIYLSLSGTGEGPASRLFLGWFGPRGLASIVFAIMVINAGVPHAEVLALAVSLTVILSLVAHGMSANPLAKWMGNREGSG